jgi:3'-phosphoadenosine 5'-phosphosulfate sulfotransferase (PAPS reductase)/FAD synthetase
MTYIPPFTPPPIIVRALQQGAALAISISGGRDSQALLNTLAAWCADHPVSGAVFAIHSDLGRVEWPQTPAHVERICHDAGVPLVVVRRAKGDLVARWQERMHQLAGIGKPFWSSAAARYCSSDLKRSPINQYLRRYALVISAEGIRAEESGARAKRAALSIRTEITAAGLQRLPLADALAYRSWTQRLAFTWNPLLDWSEDQIWAACGTSRADLAARRHLYAQGQNDLAVRDWPAHPAYVFGSSRLSCALCVLAKRSDLLVGARHNLHLFQTLLAMETHSGCTFKHGWALRDLLPDLEGAQDHE